MQTITATYSPDDDKLRIYPSSRLDAETYARVKAAGFNWAPKQEAFYGVWTPGREDLARELAGGEIDDDDRSLMDRAEERADRFGDYQENRMQDAQAARRAVEAIAEHIPFGQPILVGHHSERHARRDAERIENGMRRAVKAFETSEYWKRRAAAALRHAAYKERPDVRHRRIKTIEADKRKQEREVSKATTFLKFWKSENITTEKAIQIANMDYVTVSVEGSTSRASLWSLLTDGKMTAEEAAKHGIAANERCIAWASRWIAHYDNRLAYERAMLDESGGIKADKFNIEVGGQVKIGGEWHVVLRVNKKNGEIVSVRTTIRFVPVRGIEEVQDYRAPQGDDAEKVKEATKLPPLCNFPGEGFREMTQDEYKRVNKDYKGTRTVEANEQHGAYRYRTAFAPGGGWKLVQVFITDAKRVDPPAAAKAAAPALPDRVFDAAPAVAPAAPKASEPNPEKETFRAMRDQLNNGGGVQVVSVPQLFPTPADLAARMVEEAGIEAGHSVLEPSAGTGNIIRAIAQAVDLDQIKLTAVEIHHGLAATLSTAYEDRINTRCADFLQCSAEDLGKFDRILMNPPFADAIDIKHISHALTMLRPGGKLVAICAAGSRQREHFYALIEQCGGEWTDLPAGTFKSAHTAVNTALVILHG